MTQGANAAPLPQFSDDASATYRGYRKQALYTLWRICTDSDANRIYRPEGDEDLAIYDGAQTLVEVVQVKDYSNPLSLSDFKPGSPRGYFARMLARRRGGLHCRNTIATYGPLGPELTGAIEGRSSQRQAVVAKLQGQNAEIGTDDANAMLDALRGNVEHAQEDAMRAAIARRLDGTIAGGETNGAIDLLTFWIFDAAEHRRDITRGLLELQLERIGKHLAQLRDGSTEWMKSVVPIREEAITETEQIDLRTEYRQGVHASWRHILANADWPRKDLLKEIHESFQQRFIVIAHGASGQGKSSLAWRYLRDYAADGLRFHVRFVESRAHAMSIANVLSGHAKTLRLPAIVYLDVAPSDIGWTELLQPLAQERIRVLVTVREEDLNRAGVATTAEIGDVSLDRLSRDDAEQIYNTITASMGRLPTLDFTDAWARFRAPNGGPLLEFTHLVAEGEELSAKISSQIRRLQLEGGSSSSLVTPAHLLLLSLCAIANAADCRVDLQRACSEAGLDPVVRPFALFENEYLLRLSEGPSPSSIGPLHAIRSRAVVVALLHDRPEAWIELATRALPLIVDADLELFLLTAFSRNSEHSRHLERATESTEWRSWTQLAGIVAALLWEGVSRYEETHRPAIHAAIEQYGNALAVSALAFGIDGVFDSFRDMLAKSLGKEVPRPKLPPRDELFNSVRSWFASAQPPQYAPTRSEDWRAVGYVAFWFSAT